MPLRYRLARRRLKIMRTLVKRWCKSTGRPASKFTPAIFLSRPSRHSLNHTFTSILPISSETGASQWTVVYFHRVQYDGDGNFTGKMECCTAGLLQALDQFSSQPLLSSWIGLLAHFNQHFKLKLSGCAELHTIRTGVTRNTEWTVRANENC